MIIDFLVSLSGKISILFSINLGLRRNRSGSSKHQQSYKYRPKQNDPANKTVKQKSLPRATGQPCCPGCSSNWASRAIRSTVDSYAPNRRIFDNLRSLYGYCLFERNWHGSTRHLEKPGNWVNWNVLLPFRTRTSIWYLLIHSIYRILLKKSKY